MDNTKDNGYYLAKMKADIDFIIAHTKETDFAVFSANEVLQDCIAFRLVQISESAGHISAEFKAQYHTIPWHEISGLRNRLVHDYGNVDYRIVFDTVQEDIPVLRDSLAKIV